MTELERLMVENMKGLSANQIRLAQQLNAISERLNTINERLNAISTRLNEADATQNECAELLKQHGQFLDSLLPRT